MTSTIFKQASDSVAIVSLVGEHDLGEHDQIKGAFARAAVTARNVMVDLTECAFIDSTVIALLLGAQSSIAQNGGRMAVALPVEPNAVTRLAELVRMGDLLPTYGTREAALASISSFTHAHRSA
jgi:anti-anti-sigma factor